MDERVLVSEGARMGSIWERLEDSGAAIDIAVPDDLREQYAWASHVLIPGGADIDPKLYGESVTWARGIDHERDKLERQLVRWALNDGKPLMGICRGHQMITAMAGGTLHQDIRMDMGIGHFSQYHRIRADTRSRIGQAIGGLAQVNSFHHQAVKDVPKGWKVVAETFGAVVEAIEHPTLPVVSVQWHPEDLWDPGAERLWALFLSLREV